MGCAFDFDLFLRFPLDFVFGFGAGGTELTYLGFYKLWLLFDSALDSGFITDGAA